MTNKEWLEEQKQIDTRDNDLSYRKVKALEIIAEELIDIKDVLISGIVLNVDIKEKDDGIQDIREYDLSELE